MRGGGYTCCGAGASPRPRRVFRRTSGGTEGAARMPDLNYTDNCRRVMAIARRVAARHRDAGVSPEHVLLAMTENGRCGGAEVFRRLGADLQALRVEVERRTRAGNTPVEAHHCTHTPETKRVILVAGDEARA